MDASSVTSMNRGVMRGSSALIDAASSSLRTPAKTHQPALDSRTAHARPMPEDAPVTTAVLNSIRLRPGGPFGSRLAAHETGAAGILLFEREDPDRCARLGADLLLAHGVSAPRSDPEAALRRHAFLDLVEASGLVGVVVPERQSIVAER